VTEIKTVSHPSELEKIEKIDERAIAAFCSATTCVPVHVTNGTARLCDHRHDGIKYFEDKKTTNLLI
jgi:hypothetical protein